MKKRIWKRLFIVLLCLALVGGITVLGINGHMKKSTSGQILSPEDAAALTDVDCILVLGCYVHDSGRPSDMLADRLHRGIELYQSGAAPKLLMSGDHGQKDYNEVKAMKLEAMGKGIPSEDSGGVWLAVDIEARAAFFGWIKEVYESYFVYRFEDDAVSNINPSSYRPTWLPSGYTEFYVDETENTVAIVYADEEGRMLKLNYIQNPNETDWFVKTEQVEIESATINGKPAELFISKDSETANAIIWTSDDNTAFYLSAFLSKADLIKVAESVQVIE